MVIGMAVNATFVPDRVSYIIFMAGLAWNREMLVFESVPCFGMIKVADPFNCMEGGFRMARSAV